jgi:hypothetical protein
MILHLAILKGGADLTISLEEAENLREEEMEGVREKFSKTVAELNDQINELKNDVRRQGSQFIFFAN